MSRKPLPSVPGWKAVYFDDCTSLTGWTSRSGTWAISGGQISQTGTGASYSRIKCDKAGFVGPGSAVQVDVMFNGGSGATRRAFAYCNWDGSTTTTGLVGGVQHNGSGTWIAYTELDTVTAGTTFSLSGLSTGTWITVLLVNEGGVIRVFVNGVSTSSGCSGSVPNSTLQYTGLYTYGASASFRNLTVWQRTSTAIPGIPW